jgi:WD40 repeat protein
MRNVIMFCSSHLPIRMTYNQLAGQPPAAIGAIVVSPCGQQLATGTDSGTVSIWSLVALDEDFYIRQAPMVVAAAPIRQIARWQASDAPIADLAYVGHSSSHLTSASMSSVTVWNTNGSRVGVFGQMVCSTSIVPIPELQR